MGAARKLSLEAWNDRDPRDRRELVDGELVECEVPSLPHEASVGWIFALLHEHFGKRGGFVFASGLRLAVDADRGRIPDVACYVRGRKPEKELILTPPDIAVEVVSDRPRDARRDRIDKMADYAKYGVKQYWLVEPNVRVFEVWELEGKRYVRIGAAADGVIRLGKLKVDVDALWAHVDRLMK